MVMLKKSLCLVTAVVFLPVILPIIAIAGGPAVREKTMIPVTAVNHAPVARNQSVRTAEDKAKVIRLRATDADRNPLTYTIISGPAQGMLAGAPPRVTYTPNPNYYGPDTFTFRANDGKVDSNVAMVSIAVTSVNDAPTALNQNVTTHENTALAITLSGTDVEGNPLTYRIVSKPSRGKLTGSGSNQTYMPNINYRGPDRFTFKVNDGKAGSNIARVSITVMPMNHAPVAQDQSVTTYEDTAKAITLMAADVDGESLIYQIVAHPSHGALSGAPPSVTYTPTANYNGSDSFTFKANDGKKDSNIATISITVAPAITGHIITTVAGNGAPGYSGDDGSATEARLFYPRGVAADISGNLYLADTYNSRIRKVYTNGIITTVAGGGIMRTDGGPATEAELFAPADVAVDVSGNIYTAELCRIRRVDANGFISTVAGSECGYSGDGGPATQAQLNRPSNVTVDAPGNLYIADGSSRVRKVDTNGIISTIAGNGQFGYGGDGGPATEASFLGVNGVTMDASGNLYIADGNNRVRKVDTNGIISTIAGNGIRGYEGDGGPATEAKLYLPLSVAVDASGNLYIADDGNNCIRKVDTNGIISTIAGNGIEGYSGDDGPAILAQLRYPSGVTTDAFGNLYIADQGNNRIRLVMPKRSTIDGRVTDSATGFPLCDVMVTAKTSLHTFTTKTDSDGTYTVSGLDKGSLTATFVKSGYADFTLAGILIVDDTTTLNIQLTSIPPLNLTITSPQEGAVLNSSPIPVTGTVSHIAGVTVNGIQASLSDNSFSVSIPLIEGTNPVTATATDQYGQTASQTVNVGLITKGDITGTVTDASTGLPLASATVSVTDSLSSTQTALTDNNGVYTITGISSGAFSGSITKSGYTSYDFSGSITPGQTILVNGALSPVLPVISNIAVSGITTESATITWTTDQAAESYIDYGITQAYGNWVKDPILSTNHMVTLTNLTPASAYHFKVTSTNGNGFSSSSADRTFETQSPLLTLVITSPANGAIINRPDIMVKGRVINAKGNETGVVVNGKIAMVFGNEFVVNHIPLEGGPNTFEAIATDTEANTAATFVVVSAAQAEEYINLTASTESGISPLEVILTIDSSLDLTDATLTNIGPGEVEFLSRTFSEYRVKLTAEGIYYFAVSLNSGGTLYQDSIAIAVLSEAELDALLRGKWEGMKLALANHDAERALLHFSSENRETYRDQFTGLAALLSEIVNELSNAGINMISVEDNSAEYELLVEREGKRFSFHLQFVKDADGVWRIGRF